MQATPWLQHYSQAIPHRIQTAKQVSFVDVLEESFDKFRALPMYESMDKVLTYEKVDKLTSRFSAYLQHHTPLKPGDHIAIQIPNLLQYPVAMLGTLRAGMVAVNVNPLYTPHEMAHQLKDAAVKGIVILANFAYKLEKILHQTAIQSIIVTEVGDLLGGVKQQWVNFAVKRLKGWVPRFNLPQAIPFRHVLQKDVSAKVHPGRVKPNHTALLQYTGGTTGVSKGAVLTHANILANVEQMCAFMAGRLAVGKETFITPLPLYHIFSLTVNMLAGIKLGAKNVLIANPRDLVALIREMRKHPFSMITGVNILFSKLLKKKQFAKLDFSTLKLALAGGVALQPAVAQEWEHITGKPLIEGYGLTEASPVVSCNLVHKAPQLGTVGVPLPSTTVRIVDNAGAEVATDQPGNLWVKGPQVMQGYWLKKEETRDVLHKGWLKTGDIAVLQSDGYLKIIDRKKEMINISGFNVYPSEIEAVMTAHPGIEEACAVGVIEADGQEAVRLFLVRKDSSLTAQEVIHYGKQQLVSYKIPKYVEFRDQLPKSQVGKVLKRVLKEESMQNLAALHASQS
ncbi:MAG: AMP-binding protein [Bacteroidota bacterium]